tara:strand:- start:32 stop:163 length:132 start_codon:yes stop_codon:yes gene_type:complete
MNANWKACASYKNKKFMLYTATRIQIQNIFKKVENKQSVTLEE